MGGMVTVVRGGRWSGVKSSKRGVSLHRNSQVHENTKDVLHPEQESSEYKRSSNKPGQFPLS